jgi:hypothetical protein
LPSEELTDVSTNSQDPRQRQALDAVTVYTSIDGEPK